MICIHKKVKFKGEVYWLHGPTIHSNCFNLSPLRHYNAAGDLIENDINISYAIVDTNDILRYGKVIGHKNDLEEIK